MIRKVKVLTRVYSVRIEKRPLRNADLDERPYAGRADHMKQTIALDGAMSPQRRLETLVHEIFHAVDAATTDADSRLSERDIHRLGMGITSVLKDNPTLVAEFRAVKK